MPFQTIFVHGGRVDSRDPSLLAPGELVTADDCAYKPGDPGIWAAGTRSVFNATPEASAIVGLRFCEFHDAADKVVALVNGGTSYRAATSGLTGSFSTVVRENGSGADVSGDLAGTAQTLDSVHYGNEHVLLNGVDRNRVLKSNGKTTFHGMLPNTAAPTDTNDGGGGGYVLASGNTVSYWIEEQVQDGSGNVLRRNAASEATVLTITGTGAAQNPKIHRPTQVNPDATHFALYRTATNGSFPTGAMVSSPATPISSTFIIDGTTTANPPLPTGDIYELATVTLAGTSTSVPRNGPAPIATTGDIFEDSLVTNDISDPAAVRYSWPDLIHVFPAVNTIRFETKDADQVVGIRSLGNFFMVGLTDAMWRVNTFPRPTDAQFDAGRVKDFVAGYGVVSGQAMCVFDFGQGARLAWVSRSGLMVTDGVSWDNLTDDVRFDTLVEPSRLGFVRLENNRDEYRLEMDYTPYGGTANTATLFIHYHHTHAKPAGGGGVRAKLTWPVHRAARASAVMLTGGRNRLITGHSDGKVYVEDEGLTDASGAGGNAMAVETAEFSAPGRKTDLRVARLWAHHSAAASRVARVTLTIGNEGEDDATPWADLRLDRREATQSGKQGSGQHFRFGFTNSDHQGPLRLNYFIADVGEQGGTRQ